MRKYILSGIAALLLAACDSQPADPDADIRQQKGKGNGRGI